MRTKPGSLFPANEKPVFFIAPSYVPPAQPTLSRGNSKSASFAAGGAKADDGTATKVDSKQPGSARGAGGDITAGKPTPRRIPEANAAFFPKEPIKARVRPKTSTAARRPDRDPAAWNNCVECEDLNDRLVKLTTKAYIEEPYTAREQQAIDSSPVRPGSSSARTSALAESGSQKLPTSARSVAASEGGANNAGANLPSSNNVWRKIALSQRKPFIAGPVCYGTNTKAVPIPRRPRTAGPLVGGDGGEAAGGGGGGAATSRMSHAGGGESAAGENQRAGGGGTGAGGGGDGQGTQRGGAREELELRRDAGDNIDHLHFESRFKLGGWNHCTSLGEERTGYDRQLRYPRSSAMADIALIEAGIEYKAPKPAWAASASQFNTSNSPPPLGCY